MQELKIRPAILGDLPSITQIYNEAILTRKASCDLSLKSLEDRQNWFKQFDLRYFLLVGEMDNQVVSYAGLFRMYPLEGYRLSAENSIYIAKEYQGKKIGRSLLNEVITQARERGFHYLLAKVFTHNEASFTLHQSLGYRTIGVQKEVARLDETWADVYLMELLLS